MADEKVFVGTCSLCEKPVSEGERYIGGRPGTKWEDRVTHMECVNEAVPRAKGEPIINAEVLS